MKHLKSIILNMNIGECCGDDGHRENTCFICRKSFNNRSDAIKHLYDHSDAEILQCIVLRVGTRSKDFKHMIDEGSKILSNNKLDVIAQNLHSIDTLLSVPTDDNYVLDIKDRLLKIQEFLK